MKKLFVLLSLLITVSAITPAHAELSKQIVPALKIAGGTLAAATALTYGTGITTGIIKDIYQEYKNKKDWEAFHAGNGALCPVALVNAKPASELALIKIGVTAPGIIASAILAAKAFGYTKDVHPAIKIAGGALLGLSTCVNSLVLPYLLDSGNSLLAVNIALSPLTISTATLAAIALKSAAHDLLGK